MQESENKDSLKKDIEALKKKLLALRLKKTSGDVKDTSVFKKNRKAIARKFTELNRLG